MIDVYFSDDDDSYLRNRIEIGRTRICRYQISKSQQSQVKSQNGSKPEPELIERDGVIKPVVKSSFLVMILEKGQ